MRSFVFVLAGMLGGSLPAPAQPPSPPPRSHRSKSPCRSPPRSARSRRTRWRRPSSAISIAEAEARQAVSVLDLLATLPGLSLTQSGSAGKNASLFSRGPTRTTRWCCADGVRLNDPSSAASTGRSRRPRGWSAWKASSAVQRALRQRRAVGGVVQLITRRAPGSTRGSRAGRTTTSRGSAAGGGAGRSALRVRARQPASRRGRGRQRLLRRRRGRSARSTAGRRTPRRPGPPGASVSPPAGRARRSACRTTTWASRALTSASRARRSNWPCRSPGRVRRGRSMATWRASSRTSR